MPNLAYPPCERPGCKSPGGHPNCRCYSNISTDNLAKAGYQRPGSTLGLKRQTDPDTGKSWYSGPGNGVDWSGSSSPSQEAEAGQSIAGKVVRALKWGASTAAKIAGTYFAHGGEVHPSDLVGPHHDKDCHHYASGGEVDEINEFHENPSLSVDHHIANSGLLHALTKTGHSRSEDPNKPAEDYIDSVRRGRKSVEHHTKNHFDKKHEHPEASKDDIEALKKHLDHLRENPSELLNVGGNIPSDHAGALAAKAATATNYLNSIRPKQFQAGPLDEPMAPSKMDSQYYDRHVGIASQPLSVLGRTRDGTIQPDDLNTLKTIYPHLAQSLSNQTGAALIEAKTNGAEISHKNKMGLSHLLGQPLDATMSPVAMQAIIASAKTPERGGGKGKKSGATAATLKQLDKTDSLYESSTDRREIDKRT